MKAVNFAGLVLFCMTLLTGCDAPPLPPEVQLVLDQEQDLRRTGAGLYVPDDYAKFLAALQAGRDQLAEEQSRLAWFRDYASVAVNFREVLAMGDKVRRDLAQSREQQFRDLQIRTNRISDRLRALRDLKDAVKDSRLNNGRLSRMEVLISEAGSFASIDRPGDALARLDEAENLLHESVNVIRPFLAQFIDKAKIAHWKTLVEDVIAENRRRGGHAIVINKLRRQLTLYYNGSLVKTYPVGLGFKPIGDKLYAGDRATPEGRYEIIGKLPNSKYYRGLLINYPNQEDQRRFDEAKRRNLIPASARIGGLIEIHGGGKEGATLGCIGLDNNQMLELFDRVEIGVPVVIVAAMNTDNLVRLALERLQ